MTFVLEGRSVFKFAVKARKESINFVSLERVFQIHKSFARQHEDQF